MVRIEPLHGDRGVVKREAPIEFVSGDGLERWHHGGTSARVDVGSGLRVSAQWPGKALSEVHSGFGQLPVPGRLRASARSRPGIESAGPRPTARRGKCRLLGLRRELREGLGGRYAAVSRTDYGAAGIAGQDEEDSLPVKSGRASGVT